MLKGCRRELLEFYSCEDWPEEKLKELHPTGRGLKCGQVRTPDKKRD